MFPVRKRQLFQVIFSKFRPFSAIFAIFFQNPSQGAKGPHPSTGRLDADTNSVGPNGLAVENISWITAPSGNYQILVKNHSGCPTGMDYKVYVQIDGQYSVYEKVAPVAGVKEQVMSFNYSSLNGRSFKADIDFDVSESLSATFPDQEVTEKKNFFGF